jgi:FkbM family methyltransferase
MAFEAYFRKHVALSPEVSRLALYEIVTALHPELVKTNFKIDGDKVFVQQCNAIIAFPRPLPLIKYAHIACGYIEWLSRKYSFPGFVEVDLGDVVIDCGSYVGGFSLSACKQAKSVHLFEPDINNYGCMVKNFINIQNVHLNNLGLFNTDNELPLNISPSSVEHSFLTPDDGKILRQEIVRVERLETYCHKHDIDEIDFLKIEAEGVELEVFDGLGELRPRKLAIDASPERNGESPASTFVSALRAQGYEVLQRGYVIFARRQHF